MSKASRAQEQGSCALLTVHLLPQEQFPSRMKYIALFLETGQGGAWGPERGKSAVKLSWGGCCDGVAARCSKAGPGIYITGQVHADPCPFGEESGDNTTRKAATAALLNTA